MFRDSGSMFGALPENTKHVVRRPLSIRPEHGENDELGDCGRTMAMRAPCQDEERLSKCIERAKQMGQSVSSR